MDQFPGLASRPPQEDGKAFPVVGIGASAGGFAALPPAAEHAA
jgi:chemotaxis response regulator CheB